MDPAATAGVGRRVGRRNRPIPRQAGGPGHRCRAASCRPGAPTRDAAPPAGGPRARSGSRRGASQRGPRRAGRRSRRGYARFKRTLSDDLQAGVAHLLQGTLGVPRLEIDGLRTTSPATLSSGCRSAPQVSRTQCTGRIPPSCSKCGWREDASPGRTRSGPGLKGARSISRLITGTTSSRPRVFSSECLHQHRTQPRFRIEGRKRKETRRDATAKAPPKVLEG